MLAKVTIAIHPRKKVNEKKNNNNNTINTLVYKVKAAPNQCVMLLNN